MGADHTAGYTIAPEILGVAGKVDPLTPEGKAELSFNFQAATAFIDSSGHCLFIAFPILDIVAGFEGMVEECNGVLGTNWTTADVGTYGAAILKKERLFNEAAGIGKEADRMPEFMKIEPLHRTTRFSMYQTKPWTRSLNNFRRYAYGQGMNSILPIKSSSLICTMYAG